MMVALNLTILIDINKRMKVENKRFFATLSQKLHVHSITNQFFSASTISTIINNTST